MEARRQSLVVGPQVATEAPSYDELLEQIEQLKVDDEFYQTAAQHNADLVRQWEKHAQAQAEGIEVVRDLLKSFKLTANVDYRTGRVTGDAHAFDALMGLLK